MMKFCTGGKNPRHRCAHAETLGDPATARCQHARATLPPDPVTGDEKQEFCAIMRRPGGDCGPEAKLYDAAEPF